MMMLITAAALAAGQPATAPTPMTSDHAMPMNHEQHADAKKKCCCDDMDEAAHDKRTPNAGSHSGHDA